MKREFSKELEEDRDFEIGGEVFTWIYPDWETTAKIYDESLTPSENGDGSFSFEGDTKFAIQKIKFFLETEDRKRWDALVKRKTKPVPRHQIVQLYRWLLAEAGGNPTKPSSDSSESEDDTGNSSGGGSS